MKKQLNHIAQIIAEMWKKPMVKWVLSISLMLLFAVFFIPFWKLYPEITTKPAAPLHYNIHFGVDLFGAWWRVFMPAIFGGAILMVNIVLAIIYWQKRLMLSMVSLFVIPTLLTFLILASLFITLLNLTYD